MSTPQLEDGYVRIATELLEAIVAADFGRREYKIVLAVIRKTYGYGKKADDMTMTQLAASTGLQLPHVSATVRDLEERDVLLIRSGRYGKVIGLSKSYRTWKKKPKRTNVTKTVSDQNGHVTETVISGDRNGHNGLPKQSSEVTETVNTIDNSKRYSQKTTPKDNAPTSLRSGGPQTRRQQIPEDFVLTPEREAYLDSTVPGLDAKAEFSHFTDHHLSRASTMADWDAAWRTWCRNAKKFNGGRHGRNEESPLESVLRAYSEDHG